MVKFTILAGGFSTFIATYIFDSDASSLLLTKQNPTGTNPSWIASHPRNSSILYAVNENPIGSLQSFVVDSKGGLSLVDSVLSGGNGPTFTNPLSTGEVTGMNFGSGNCSFVPTIQSDPLYFQKNSSVLNLPVHGGPSNPHMSLEYNDEVLVTDLGADKIWRLTRDDSAPGKFKVQGQIDITPGNGPRHMAIQDDILFVVNELTSTLTAQQIPTAPNGTALPLIANVSIVPSDVKINGTFRGAELLISEASDLFPEPLIYVSNRNLGPEFDQRGDSIAIFKFNSFTQTTTFCPDTIDNSSSTTPTSGSGGNVVTTPIRRRLHARQLKERESRSITTRSGALTLQNQAFTGLQQIRSMAIGRVADGGEKYLIAGANVDGGVVMFNRTDGGRNLTEVARNQDLANRTSFVFV